MSVLILPIRALLRLDPQSLHADTTSHHCAGYRRTVSQSHRPSSVTRQAVGLLVVGHGSRRAEANAALRTAAESVAAGPPAEAAPVAESVAAESVAAEPPAAESVAAESVAAEPPAAESVAAESVAAESVAAEPPAAEVPWLAVGHAFLELSEPGIEDAYGQLVKAGCQTIVVSLFFLFPGAHTMSDIPAQLDRAAARHPGARWVITEPLGLHPAVLQAARARIDAVHPSA